MNKIINWLSERKGLNLIIALAYFVAVVLPHKRFGTFLNTKVFKGITRAEYNQMVIYIALVALAVFLILFVKNSLQVNFKNKLWLFMALNIVMAAVIINTLFVINIEMIHFPQYALFAILFFPMVKDYRQTLIWATIFGAIDEAYQYFYLAPKDTSYYDWNDVVTNLIGAVFGLLFLWSFSVKEKSPRTVFFKSSAFYGLLSLAALVGVLCLIGVMSIYPSETAPYQLLRVWPDGFWSTVHPNVTYHLMRPLEGVVVTGLLLYFFQFIGHE